MIVLKWIKSIFCKSIIIKCHIVFSRLLSDMVASVEMNSNTWMNLMVNGCWAITRCWLAITELKEQSDLCQLNSNDYIYWHEEKKKKKKRAKNSITWRVNDEVCSFHNADGNWLLIYPSTMLWLEHMYWNYLFPWV